MLIRPSDDEKDGNDFFESEAQPEKTEKEPKKPTYKPEDPAYWDEEESEWAHLRPRRSSAPWIWAGAAVVVIAIIIGIRLRFFTPCVEEATQFGYVEQIDKRGTVFKTYEGVLLPYKELMDTTRVYRRDFIFTAENESIAICLKKAQMDARPVRVEYRQYHATVPWRGASKTVIVGVDSVDPSKILPPEFTPETAKPTED